MPSHSSPLLQKVEKYHFQLKHLLIILVVLLFFQGLVSIIHKTSLRSLLVKTQDWYQRDSAERLANLTATSLELLLETTAVEKNPDDEFVQRMVQAFNIILSQQLLQKNVQEICLLLEDGDSVFVVDNGQVLFDYFFRRRRHLPQPDSPHATALHMFQQHRQTIAQQEQIISVREGRQTFHVFVPLVPKGEFAGALYLRNTPDFTFITREVISNFDETSLIYASLIFLGLLAMFYISSYTVKERDEAQQLYFMEREKLLREQIEHQKESIFTKRIYHTHHKAEKIMGFIKEDLRLLSTENIEAIKYRMNKYANFISRVIYDMKWYDQPIQSVRNPLFSTNLNEVIRFLVENIFQRLSTTTRSYRFELALDDALPPVSVNEFVVWEILEPLIQNAIEHAGVDEVTIRIATRYDPDRGRGQIIIADNGQGICPELLETNEQGIKKLFLEYITTKQNGKNSGFGCYLAYEIATERCGWKLDAGNRPEGGSQFVLTIPYPRKEDAC